MEITFPHPCPCDLYENSLEICGGSWKDSKPPEADEACAFNYSTWFVVH